MDAITVKGNKPPGVAVYNIEVQTVEELRELVETTATIEELHIGSITIQMVEERFIKGTTALQKQYRIGEFAAKRAMTVLELMRPYPGDDLDAIEETKNHFLVYQIEGGK